MKAHDDAQSLIAEITRHKAIDRAVARQPHHRRHDPNHVGPGQERHMAEPFETDLEDRLAGAHVGVVARDIGWRQARHFAAHGFRIAAVVERLAVRKADPIERRHRTQVDVVGEPAAAEPPKLFKEKRRRHDGRPGIERKAILTVDVGASSGGVEPFQNGDPIPPRAKPDRSCQPAESTANDNRMGFLPPSLPAAGKSARQVRCKSSHTFECINKLTFDQRVRGVTGATLRLSRLPG
jgi:hypothetical protein